MDKEIFENIEGEKEFFEYIKDYIGQKEVEKINKMVDGSLQSVKDTFLKKLLIHQEFQIKRNEERLKYENHSNKRTP